MKKHYWNVLMKLLALFIPFYFVYYGPLYDDDQASETRVLWKYIFIGFCLYLALFIFLRFPNI